MRCVLLFDICCCCIGCSRIRNTKCEHKKSDHSLVFRRLVNFSSSPLFIKSHLNSPNKKEPKSKKKKKKRELMPIRLQNPATVSTPVLTTVDTVWPAKEETNLMLTRHLSKSNTSGTPPTATRKAAAKLLSAPNQPQQRCSIQLSQVVTNDVVTLSSQGSIAVSTRITKKNPIEIIDLTSATPSKSQQSGASPQNKKNNTTADAKRKRGDAETKQKRKRSETTASAPSSKKSTQVIDVDDLDD